MKKILIVIHDMKIGGAQKSLLSFLKGLYESGRADAYEIHLLVSRPGGEFRKGIPAQVKILEPSPELYWLGVLLLSFYPMVNQMPSLMHFHKTILMHTDRNDMQFHNFLSFDSFQIQYISLNFL